MTGTAERRRERSAQILRTVTMALMDLGDPAPLPPPTGSQRHVLAAPEIVAWSSTGEPVEPETRTEVIATLEALLRAVDDGVLTADGPAAAALVRRLEGALLALRVQQDSAALPEPEAH